MTNINEFYQRGLKGNTATRYRKGACENCGALTHKKKDCLERPRKVGAKYSGEAFAPDEVHLPKLNQDYDGKRDRWNGYDPEMYKFVLDEYEKVEDAKRQLKEQKMKEDLLTAENKSKDKDGESDSDEDEDEKYADHVDMPGTKVDSKQRITVRNLRIREDVAKYLRNLDIDSAYYDPKTRSMRDNPYKTTGKPEEELTYAGENFNRYTGDTQKVSNAQLFAWQAYEKGVDVHLQAEPTKAELLHKEFKIKKDEFKDNVKQNILEKYGGEEHLKDVPPKELIFAQSENYVEYSRHGNVIKGAEVPTIKSVYEEDVYINNHTTVWGSYYSREEGSWGFKCCHSLVKNSYCTGSSGREANAASCKVALLTSEEPCLPKEPIPSNDHSRSPKRNRLSSDSEDDEEELRKQKKLKKALHNEKQRQNDAEKLLKLDERKRPYNSMYEAKEPTEDELEAYKIRRKRDEDPMAAFVDK